MALQFPEGLQMYACVIADILERFAGEGWLGRLWWLVGAVAGVAWLGRLGWLGWVGGRGRRALGVRGLEGGGLGGLSVCGSRVGATQVGACAHDGSGRMNLRRNIHHTFSNVPFYTHTHTHTHKYAHIHTH